ncbi:MAG TPA: hypothetical protein VK453_27640 [Micromonosporaceae bacterium]|nr:hypothetical protein [Micromonosporaceae bacterium]
MEACIVLVLALVGMVLLGLGFQLLFDPPSIFLVTYTTVTVIAVPANVLFQIRPAKLRQHRAVVARNQRVQEAAEEAERRWRVERLHRFTI